MLLWNDMDYYFITNVFFTLLFVVDPLGLIPVFISYLPGRSPRERRAVIIKSVFISILVSAFFIAFGNRLLVFLGISSGAFLAAGGVLLFMISIEMLFGRPSRIEMRDYRESDLPAEEDVSVFPLAIPMLCGPGNIAALLMFSAQAKDDPVKLGILTASSVLIFLIAAIAMIFSQGVARIIGKTGISVTQRLMGLILSAMSVQFIRNGLILMGFAGIN